MVKSTIGGRIFDLVNTLFMVGIALLCLLPFINIIAISFSESAAAGAGMVKLWPVGFNLDSYGYALSKPEFLRAFLVSVLRVVIGLAISLFVTIMAAYPISKDVRDFKARGFYSWYFFITMLFSGGLIPFYMVVRTFKLTNNLLGIILPWAAMAYTLILMVGFFRSLPKELCEAAIVDGAGHMRTLWNIIVPISMPGIATVALVTGVFYWNEWFFGLILMNDNTKYPLQSYMQTVVVAKSYLNLSGASLEQLKALAKISDRTLKSAQIILAMLPILIFYPFIQKHFIKGLVLGSVKG